MDKSFTDAQQAQSAQESVATGWQVVTWNTKTDRTFSTKQQAIDYITMNDAVGDWHVEQISAQQAQPAQDFDLELAANQGAAIIENCFPDLTKDQDRVDLYRCAKAILRNAPNCPPLVSEIATLNAVICRGTNVAPEANVVSTYPYGSTGERKAKWFAKALAEGSLVRYETIVLYRKEIKK